MAELQIIKLYNAIKTRSILYKENKIAETQLKYIIQTINTPSQSNICVYMLSDVLENQKNNYEKSLNAIDLNLKLIRNIRKDLGTAYDDTLKRVEELLIQEKIKEISETMLFYKNEF